MVLAGLVVLVTLIGLASSGPATAADEVHFDPDSPAGKEYALPLDQAREEATGGGKADEDSAAGAPLFGAGVSPPGAGVSPPGSASTRVPNPGGEQAGGRGANREADNPGRRGAAAGPAAIVRIAEAGDGYSLTSGAALVAAIVLVGGALGLALRALQRRALPD
ncbi:MAG: hypothetical protein WA862_05015 [Solirubrobacterales bacterium]